MFHVAPERVGQIKIACVCLEHGKPDPRPAIPYEMRPLSALSNDPRVAQLLKMMANDELSREVAQASAWHLANGMTWEELAAKRIKRANGMSYSYFAPDVVAAAFKATSIASERAEAVAPSSPGYDLESPVAKSASTGAAGR